MKANSCQCGDWFNEHNDSGECIVEGCMCLHFEIFNEDEEDDDDKPEFEYQTAGEEITHRYGEHVGCGEGPIITGENIDEIINRHWAKKQKKAINLAGEGLIFLAAAYRVGLVSAKDQRLAITDEEWEAAQKRFLKALEI